MFGIKRKGPGLPILIFLSIITFFGSGAAYVFLIQFRHFRSFVSSEPTFTAPSYSLYEGQAALEKVNRFVADEGGDTLALSADELNAMMLLSQSLEKLNYGYALDFQDSTFTARASVPLVDLQSQLSGFIRLLNLSGYVNSELIGYPRLQDGKLELIPVAARMNDREAPINALIKQGYVNIGDLADDKEAYANFLSRLDDVLIRSGSLLFIRNSRS